jgi:antirestriction protein
MDINPLDSVETTDDTQTADRRAARLNILVAITIAILATFMGICKVKDDNIVQGMQQAQANKLDHWAFYQARNIREEVAKSAIVQLQLAALGRRPDEQATYQAAIRNYEKIAAEQNTKKEELRKQAEQDQKDYDAANFIDDQFDLSDALLAIAISLLAMTALTHQRWLYYVALVPTGFGILMGLSGLLNWGIHPDALTRLLS